LRLPGYGENGPTLEIYQYDGMVEKPAPAANRLGLGHLAFLVDDVKQKLRQVLEAGGKVLGEVSEHEVEGVGYLSFVYACDPEGNILELQNRR
jgi:predicted enzyme related to lactoylglutathione lyase